MRDFHDDQQGIRYVDWCYQGEEMLMQHLQIDNDPNKQRPQQEALSNVPRDKLKNTLCTQCKEYKRKRDFPELKDVKARGQQLTGVCTACKNWMRKRDIKLINKDAIIEQDNL